MTTPPDNKITLTLEQLGVLAETADKNGTQSAFVQVAMQWASQAHAEIGNLKSDLAAAQERAEKAEAERDAATKMLKEESKRLVAVLKERDHNGKMWRWFEMLCNQNNCWKPYSTGKEAA